MRTSIAIASLAMILGAAPVATLAQTSDVEFQSVPNTTPLAITVNPAPTPKGDSIAPHFVTITLTNTGDEAVRFPMPAIGCVNAQAGYVALVTEHAQSVPACTAQELAANPLETKKWTVLKPGETANFGEMVTPLLPKGAGTFEVRGIYVPPTLAADTAEQLYRDSVVYPKDRLTSAPAQIIREAE